jgi:monoamine oxidase
MGFLSVLGKPEGRIHFAGEHTSAWTGRMQGALDSARRVVREIGG